MSGTRSHLMTGGTAGLVAWCNCRFDNCKNRIAMLLALSCVYVLLVIFFSRTPRHQESNRCNMGAPLRTSTSIHS